MKQYKRFELENNILNYIQDYLSTTDKISNDCKDYVMENLENFIKRSDDNVLRQEIDYFKRKVAHYIQGYMNLHEIYNI